MSNSASRPASAHTGAQSPLSPLGSPLRSPASTLRQHTVGAGLGLSLGDTDPAKAYRSHVKSVLRRRPWSAIIPKSASSLRREGSDAVAPPAEEELRAILSKMGTASIDKSAKMQE